MIRRNQEKTVERHERKFGAEGFITVRSLINSDEELNGHGRVFAHTTVHTGDTEIYYVYSGRGEYNDNGEVSMVEAGDVTFTPAGCGHGIKCVGGEPLELIALILYG